MLVYRDGESKQPFFKSTKKPVGGLTYAGGSDSPPVRIMPSKRSGRSVIFDNIKLPPMPTTKISTKTRALPTSTKPEKTLSVNLPQIDETSRAMIETNINSENPIKQEAAEKLLDIHIKNELKNPTMGIKEPVLMGDLPTSKTTLIKMGAGIVLLIMILVAIK